MCKPKIKKMNRFVKIITFGFAAGITLSPFGIYIQEKYFLYRNIKEIINHEEIHWKQQMEMLIIPFYLWYLVEWIWKVCIYGKDAYYNISFEREAHKHDSDLNYLNNRTLYSWMKYIGKDEE